MAAIPQDLLDRIRDLEREVRQLQGRVNIRPAMNKVLKGNVRIGEGGRLIVEDDDQSPLLYTGGIVPDRPDGTTQRGTLMWRDTGELAFALHAGTNGKQSLTVIDGSGNQVFRTVDQGLARPFLPLPMYPVPLAQWPSTASGSFEALWSGEVARQQPKIRVAAVVWNNTAGATGQVRLTMDGTPVGAVLPADNASTKWAIWDVAVPGGAMQAMNLVIEGRVASGGGSLHCRMFEAHGGDW
ncbi:hypothetical protein [Yinghuangia soli]|uniref:Uncharacterized protein n=1 Tax=Yinghuangia soli TaxID=2908204 RepID=A0AA41Q703_9ACTN|nr:hypothetical protein [Yinghuangia soli]MCF2532728.1 hypothetical protein [Yinghuangia soli]